MFSFWVGKPHFDCTVECIRLSSIYTHHSKPPQSLWGAASRSRGHVTQMSSHSLLWPHSDTESYRGLTEIFFQTLYDLKATCTKILQKALRYSNFFQTQQPHSIYKSNRAIQIHNAFTPTMHTTIQMQVVLQEGYSNAQSTQRIPSSQTITACCVRAIKRWHYQWCKEHGHGQPSCLRQCQ
jgi:hypothetical protein